MAKPAEKRGKGRGREERAGRKAEKSGTIKGAAIAGYGDTRGSAQVFRVRPRLPNAQVTEASQVPAGGTTRPTSPEPLLLVLSYRLMQPPCGKYYILLDLAGDPGRTSRSHNKGSHSRPQLSLPNAHRSPLLPLEPSPRVRSPYLVPPLQK